MAVINSRLGLLALLLAGGGGTHAGILELPNPLELVEIPALARENRDEIAAARARAAAARERPAIVAALEDPMLSAAVDHYPFEPMDEGMANGRYDWSFSLEQRFPLSGVRGHRRRAAQADAQRLEAQAQGAVLKVEVEAMTAALMLWEKRRLARVAEEQSGLARELVSAAAARYAAAVGNQVDLLRAEAEAARAEAEFRAVATEIRAGEAMFNAALGRSVAAPVPELVGTTRDLAPPPLDALLDSAGRNRPELREGAAEVRRAGAEIAVMRSMYRPMAMLRVGRMSTMAEGDGAMVMVGISVPVWRSALRAGVDEAAAMETMARADLRGMRRMVDGEVAAARHDIEAARVRFLALAGDVVPRAELAVRGALAGYQSGGLDLTAAIESMRALCSAEAAAVMAEVELEMAWLRLDRAIGDVDRLR